MLEVTLFGSPRVRRGGRELRFDTRKAVALLALLGVTGAAWAREALAELLWPGLDRTRARAALRRTLSVAASQVPELQISGAGVELVPGTTRVDVVEFRRLAAADDPASWVGAIELAPAPFLEGFTLRDSPAFDEWQYGQAGELRDELALLLGMLSTDAARSGDPARALGYARRRVAADPLSEPAHVEVVRLAALMGDRSSALRAYQDLVRVLDSELGVAPLPATERLHRAIQEGALDPISPPGSPPRTDGAAPDPLALQLAAALAILGVPADAELLRSVAGRDDAEIAAALPDALRRGLIVADDDGRHRVPSGVAAELVQGLPLARRRLLHGRAAEALARRAATDDPAASPGVVGLRFADAGRDAEAVGWFVAAAEAATARGEHSEALDWWRSAVAVGSDTVDVQLALATTLIRLGRYAEAHVSLGRAAELAGDDSGLRQAASAALAAAESAGDLEGVIVWRSHLADLLHTAGREDEAREMQQRWAEAIAAHPGRAAAWTLGEW